MKGKARSCACVVAAVLFHAPAQAGMSYSSGTAVFTHTRNGSGSPSVSSPFSLPMGSTYSHSYSTSAGAKTQGVGKIGITTNSTTATFTLAGGSGVSESDPSGEWANGSRLKIDLNNLQWNVTSGGFGATSTAYVSITVAGIVGSGGAASFSISGLGFTNSGGTNIAPSLSTGSTVTMGSSGSFTKTITLSAILNGGSLPSGSMKINGDLNFFVNNDDTPSLIEPIAVDAGGAPPTAQFDSDMLIEGFGGTANWSDPLNWNSPLITGQVPNTIGDRALFMPATNRPMNRTVTVDAPIVVGTVDINDVAGGEFNVEGPGLLRFEVDNQPGFEQHAVLQQRNTRGDARATVGAAVELADPLDIHVDSAQGLAITGAISTAPGVVATPINKFGPGVLTLAGANTFMGGINVLEGGLIVTGLAAATNLPINAAPGANVIFIGSNGANFNGNIAAGGGLATPTNLNIVGQGQFNIGRIDGGGAVDISVISDGPTPAILRFVGPNFNGGTLRIARGTVELAEGGSMLNVPLIDNSGVLRINNLNVASQDRLGDTTAIRLTGAELGFAANATVPVNENYGATIVDGGQSAFTIVNNAGGFITVTSQALQRQNNGLLFLRGDSLGTTSFVMFNVQPQLVGSGGPAGTPFMSIVPFASGASNPSSFVPTSLLTYTPSEGLRPLNDVNEYANTFGAGSFAPNVRIGGGASVGFAQSINSLVAAGATISGASLNINSGVILSTGSTTISTPISFGSEGILTVSGGATFSGIMSGSFGLTKAGAGVATLNSPSNNYSGTTLVQNGNLNFVGNVSSGLNGPLGNSSSAVVLAPGANNTARLLAAGNATTTFSRPLIVAGSPGGTASFGTTGTPGQVLVMNGTINLDQNLNIAPNSVAVFNGGISGAGGLIGGDGSNFTLNAANTYLGGTTIGASTVVVGNDGALGNGPVFTGSGGIAGTGGTRTIANPVMARSNFNVLGTSPLKFTGTIDLGGIAPVRQHVINNTAGTEYAGELLNGGLIKQGNGPLTISSENFFNGTVTINQGELIVVGGKPLGDPCSPTIVNAGATLRLSQNLIPDESPNGSLLVANPARMVEPIILNGSGVGGIGALRSSAPRTAVGSLTLASASTVHVEPTSQLDVLTLDPFSTTMTLAGGGILTVDHVRGGTLLINGGSTLRVRSEGDPAGGGSLNGASRIVG